MKQFAGIFLGRRATVHRVRLGPVGLRGVIILKQGIITGIQRMLTVHGRTLCAHQVTPAGMDEVLSGLRGMLTSKQAVPVGVRVMLTLHVRTLGRSGNRLAGDGVSTKDGGEGHGEHRAADEENTESD